MKRIVLFFLCFLTFKSNAYEVHLQKNQKELREDYFLSEPSNRIYIEAERAVETFSESFYSYSTIINTRTGLYWVDCSSFISHLLALTAYKWYEKIYAHGVLSRYPTQRNNPPIDRCLAKDFFYFFYKHNSRLNLFKGWQIISDPRNIKPGDIIAIKYGTEDDNTGHVLMAADYPITDRVDITSIYAADPDSAGGRLVTIKKHTEYAIKIIDSSASPHGNIAKIPYYPDSRLNNPKNIDDSGIGRGYMCLAVNTEDDETKISYYKRSAYIGSHAYFMPDNTADPNLAVEIRDIRIGRAVEFDDNPAYYSNYYGVNVENIAPYKNLDIAPTDNDSRTTREAVVIRSNHE